MYRTMGTVFIRNNINRQYRSRRVTATAGAGREGFSGINPTGTAPRSRRTGRLPSLWNLTRLISSAGAILDIWDRSDHFPREDDRSGMPTVENKIEVQSDRSRSAVCRTSQETVCVSYDVLFVRSEEM